MVCDGISEKFVRKKEEAARYGCRCRGMKRLISQMSASSNRPNDVDERWEQQNEKITLGSRMNWPRVSSLFRTINIVSDAHICATSGKGKSGNENKHCKKEKEGKKGRERRDFMCHVF